MCTVGRYALHSQSVHLLNLVVAVLRGSIGRVIAVLRDRLLLLSLLVERFALTLINEDYYYYYYY